MPGLFKRILCRSTRRKRGLAQTVQDLYEWNHAERKRGDKEVSKQARTSVGPIEQNCTGPANVFLSFCEERADFSLGCSEGSGTQSSREI